MMREYKFRLWDKKERCMYDWDTAIGFMMDYVRDPQKIHNDFVVMQYTNMNDASGIEIYEGDIVETIPTIPGTEHLDLRGVVVMEGLQYCIENMEKGLIIPLWNESLMIRVVGNIYNNVGLL